MEQAARMSCSPASGRISGVREHSRDQAMAEPCGCHWTSLSLRWGYFISHFFLFTQAVELKTPPYTSLNKPRENGKNVISFRGITSVASSLGGPWTGWICSTPVHVRKWVQWIPSIGGAKSGRLYWTKETCGASGICISSSHSRRSGRTLVCAYVHVVCVCMYLCMYACVWTCIYLYICMCICMGIHMHVHTCVYVCVCMFMHRSWVSVAILELVWAVS